MNRFNRLGLFFTLLVGFGAYSPVFAMRRNVKRPQAHAAPLTPAQQEEANFKAAQAEQKRLEDEARVQFAREAARAKVMQEAADKADKEKKEQEKKEREEKVENMTPLLRGIYRMTESLANLTQRFNGQNELQAEGAKINDNIAGAGETVRTFGQVMGASALTLAGVFGFNEERRKEVLKFNHDNNNIPAIGGAVLASLATLMFMDEIKSGLMSMVSSDKDAEPVKYTDLDKSKKEKVDVQAAAQAAVRRPAPLARGARRPRVYQQSAVDKDAIANSMFKRGWFGSIDAK